MTGDFIWLAVSQLDVQHASESAIRVEASATRSFVSVSQAMIRGYDRTGTRQPAFDNVAQKTRLWVRESYLRRGWVINPCRGASSCEVEFDNEL